MNCVVLGGALAALGFIAAAILHLFAVLGADLTESMPSVYAPLLLLPLLTAGFFVVARRLELAGLAVPEAFARVPGVLKIVAASLVVYGVLTFGVVGARLDNAHPTLVDGQPALQADHGGPVRLTTEVIHRSQRAAQMRLLSLVLMIFYFGLGAYFLGGARFVRQQQRQPRALSGRRDP